MDIPPAKRRRTTIKPYKIQVHVQLVKFFNVNFPVCLKVAWLMDNLGLETRPQNAPNAEVSFKKKLKRECYIDATADYYLNFTVMQKVGTDEICVARAAIDISPLTSQFRNANIKVQRLFTEKLEAVKMRDGIIQINVSAKPVVRSTSRKIGSHSGSSQRLNLLMISKNETVPLLPFEDVYMHVLRDYPHIFSLDFVLEHPDQASRISMDEANTEGMDQSEILRANELFLSLNLFQEMDPYNMNTNFRYHIPPATFDLAAFKRCILHYQSLHMDQMDLEMVE